MAINTVGAVSGLNMSGVSETTQPVSTSFGTLKQINEMSSADFSAKMANASNQDLTKLLGTAGISDARRTEIAKELATRFDTAGADSKGKCGGAGGAGGAKGDATEEADDEKRIKELLKKLASGKTLTAAETKELNDLLGKDQSAQDTTPGGKGKTALTV